jgi:hypothetical protein
MRLSDLELIELNSLLDRLVENSLSIHQKKKLEDFLKHSEEARKYYISYLDMSVSLSHYADETLADIEARKETAESTNLIEFIQSWIPLAAILALGFYLFYTLSGDRLPIEENQVEPAQDSFVERIIPQQTEVSGSNVVAVMTKSVGLFDPFLPLPKIGSDIESGELSFSNGMAQLEFMQGATVILEGPVKTTLIHTNALKVERGKMRAHVPKVAVGFTVNLPMGKVIDLGTDFGVEVDEEGAAEIYVYRGKVSYRGVDFEGNEVTRELSGGEAIYLDSFGVSTPLDMPLGSYLGSADLASRSFEIAQRRRSAWNQMSQEIANDSNTLLYYGFDNQETWSRVLKDKTNRNNGSGDGAVIGCQWSEGRWPGKGALHFSKNNDRVCLNVTKSLPSATLVAWVKLDALNNWGAPLVYSQPNQDGAFGWFVSPKGKMVLEVLGPREVQLYESAVAFAPDRLGEWVHIATSFDGKNKWVTHFLNGRSFSREKLNSSGMISLKRGLIGHYHAFPGRNPNFSMKGSIDEFAIFDSVWGEDDIRQLFEVGCPRESSLIKYEK